MCIGVPMQVLDGGALHARCRRGEQQEMVDMLLVGPQPEGAWVQVFLGSARECLSAEQAEKIEQALRSLQLAMQGDNAEVEHLFADLIDREPELPAHLRETPTT
ncbi:MAG: HypC/HybG/HupF family hydrogenase formation chaperone [Granulosicoccaceae bacterium]